MQGGAEVDATRSVAVERLEQNAHERNEFNQTKRTKSN